MQKNVMVTTVSAARSRGHIRPTTPPRAPQPARAPLSSRGVTGGQLALGDVTPGAGLAQSWRSASPGAPRRAAGVVRTLVLLESRR